MTEPQGAEAFIRRLRNQADSLEAAAEWFKECKVLRLERLPTGFIAALRAGAEMLRAAALSGGARPQDHDAGARPQPECKTCGGAGLVSYREGSNILGEVCPDCGDKAR